jgi:hypothetical protein
MRISFTLAILGALNMGTRQAQAATGQSITVIVYNYAAVSQTILEIAEREAGRIVGSAGIKLRWLNCQEDTAQPAAGCSQSPGSAEILLHLLGGAATRRMTEPGAFGFALPADAARPGFFAGVFCDGLAEFVSPRVTKASVLGHVIAHEIGHLLLGANRHSAAGIMKADWRHKDLELATQGRLVFSESERRCISENLRHRRANIADAGLPNR